MMNLKQIYKAQKDIYSAVEKLQHLSDSFSAIGNYQLAGHLENIANNVLDNTEVIIETISDGIHEDYVDTQNNFGSILSEMLNAIDGD